MANQPRIRESLSWAFAAVLLGAATLTAQSQQSLSSTMNVFVFPTEGQDSSQQSMDEADCYSWAVQNTGVDPFELAREAEAVQQQGQAAQNQAMQSSQGSVAAGAVGGAMVGALIGGVARGTPRRGLRVGATVGAIAGSGARAKGQAQAAQVEQQTQQALAYTQEKADNFKKAFSVCLEAKAYMVRY